jgi:outer membrane protein
MKKIALMVASVALFLFAHSAFADLKIAVVDVSKILADSKEVAEAKAQLKKQFDPRQDEITAAQKKLRSEIDDYTKNSPTMKADAAKSTQNKIMDDQKKLQDLETSFQNDLSKEQNQKMQDILNHIETVIKKVAADKGYDLVVTRMSTAYVNPKLDVTAEVSGLLKK